MSLAYQNPVKRVPCPFCGKADVTIGCEGSTYYVYCCGCRVQGRWANSIEEAEQAWATRPIESAAQADKHAALKELAAERDALKEEMKRFAKVVAEQFVRDMKSGAAALRIENEILKGDLHRAEQKLKSLTEGPV